MISTAEVKHLIADSFGFLFEPELLEEIISIGKVHHVAAGELFMDIGQSISHIPLLIEGNVKIMRENAEGHELLIYFLERGDTCAMSLSCCMGNKKSDIRAVAEEDTTLIMIAVEHMDKWLQKYRSWRNFIFDSYQIRLNELMETLDSVAFLRMDERLLKYLNDKVKITGSTILNSTHQDIASDMNTSRVVISRLMKQLEKQGKVKIGRNKLELLNF